MLPNHEQVDEILNTVTDTRVQILHFEVILPKEKITT